MKMYTAQAFHGHKLRAEDGEFGVVDDFYFDDETWSIRYVVVETGHWLRSRRVLISPLAIEDVDDDARRIDVHLTKDQIAHSPPIESDIPVSRQKELQYRQYFSWPVYWISAYYATPDAVGYLPAAAAMDGRAWRREALRLKEPDGDRHLRSTAAVTGYHVMAHEVEVGRADDFVLDTDAWTLRYLVLDGGGLFHHQRKAISVYWIDRISWETSTVVLNRSRRQIEALPQSMKRVEIE